MNEDKNNELIDFSSFFSRAEYPDMIKIAAMTAEEKDISYVNEYANGKLIINYSPTTDSLSREEKQALESIYDLDLKFKYDIIDITKLIKPEVNPSNPMKISFRLDCNYMDKSNFKKSTFFDTLFGRYEWACDKSNYEHIENIYNNIQPELKSAEGKTIADSRKNKKSLINSYEKRMKPVWKQQNKAEKLEKKIRSLIPRESILGKKYWTRFDENYNKQLETLVDDINKYFEDIDNDLNQFLNEYDTKFTEYKQKIAKIENDFKENIKSKDFKNSLKTKKEDIKNWERAQKYINKITHLKTNKKLRFDENYKNDMSDIGKDIANYIKQITPENAEEFISNYRDIKKEYVDRIKQAEKKVKIEARKKRYETEKHIRKEKLEKLISWFKPKIKNGRNPIL